MCPPPASMMASTPTTRWWQWSPKVPPSPSPQNRSPRKPPRRPARQRRAARVSTNVASETTVSCDARDCTCDRPHLCDCNIRICEELVVSTVIAWGRRQVRRWRGNDWNERRSTVVMLGRGCVVVVEGTGVRGWRAIFRHDLRRSAGVRHRKHCAKSHEAPHGPTTRSEPQDRRRLAMTRRTRRTGRRNDTDHDPPTPTGSCATIAGSKVGSWSIPRSGVGKPSHRHRAASITTNTTAETPRPKANRAPRPRRRPAPPSQTAHAARAGSRTVPTAPERRKVSSSRQRNRATASMRAISNPEGIRFGRRPRTRTLRGQRPPPDPGLRVTARAPPRSRMTRHPSPRTERRVDDHAAASRVPGPMGNVVRAEPECLPHPNSNVLPDS